MSSLLTINDMQCDIMEWKPIWSATVNAKPEMSTAFLRRMWLYEQLRISSTISQLSYLWWDKLFMVSTEMTLLSSFVIWTLTSSQSSTGITSPSLYLIQTDVNIARVTNYDVYQIRLEALASVTVQVMSTEEPLFAKMSGAPSIFVTGTEASVVSE